MMTLSFNVGLGSDSTLGQSPQEAIVFDGGWKEAAPTRFNWMATRPVQASFAVLFFVLMSSLWCHSADLVFIQLAGGTSSEQHDIELAAQFYGLNLRVETVSGKIAGPVPITVQQNDTVGVVIEADALAAIGRTTLLRALSRKSGTAVPLLIRGVAPETDPTLLKVWSSDLVVGARRLASPRGLHYLVGNAVGLTEQLTDLEIPFPSDDGFYFVSPELSGSHVLMSVRNGHQVLPVFVETDIQQQRIFLLSKKHRSHGRAEPKAEDIEHAFSEIAPEMFFTKFCAGERGWHALQHYANLTIDDPWLRESYGHLIYQDLLEEMERHNFHTTIAFIPWNYDRSEAETVALFRNHPERFSICVHGDNHDHKEFDDFESKPLSLQITAIKQSLARMEEFHSLTQIPYDNVFVFPHNIGSESILEELKRYNFAATVNSMNVPIHRARPPSPLFALRPVTLSFGDFPSILRYSAANSSPTSLIAINQFLGNPVFFYCHHDFFASGIDAFDHLADEVNKRQPDTRWRSLGDIVKHLYLVRLRDDSDYDVFAFASSLDLNNASGRNSVFHIQKQEGNSVAIESVSVDGQEVPFQLEEGYLHVSVGVPVGGSRSIVIRYKNDLDLASVSTSKSSYRMYLLRMASDFRDITLSKSSIGRAVTDYYYAGKVSPLLVICLGCVVVVLGVCGTCVVLLVMKRKQTVALKTNILLTDLNTSATVASGSIGDRTSSAARAGCNRS